MEKVYKFPVTHYQKHKNKMGKGYVPCMVSDRWIQFPENSVGHYGGGEFIDITIMTHSYAKDKPVKLCDMIITREDLERALKNVKPPKDK